MLNMLNSVKVKDVEREQIWIAETNVDYETWLSWAILITSCVLLFIAFLLVPNKNLNFAFFFAGGLLLLLIRFVFGIGTISKPAYHIYLTDYYPEKIVVKTTPEADQIAICKAVQELEPIAKELSKKKREMEQIACKCK